jgi:hypothetical protein
MSVLTGAPASYFWQGVATAMPTAPDNTAPNAVVVAHQTDANLWYLWDGTAWQQLQGAPNIRLTHDTESGNYFLQYSLDGGTTWTDVTAWDVNFPKAVQHFAPKITMNPLYTYPPIPEMLTGGDDYVYDPAYD